MKVPLPNVRAPRQPAQEMSYAELRRLAYVLGGALFVLGGIALFGPKMLWPLAIAGVAIAACKEFWRDMRAGLGSTSEDDFAFHFIGMVAATGFFLLAHWLEPRVPLWHYLRQDGLSALWRYLPK